MFGNISRHCLTIQRNTWFRNLILVNSFETLKPVVDRTLFHIQHYKYFQYKSLSTVSSMTNPIVRLDDGEVKGKVVKDYIGNDFISFLGIPYAKPPLGKLRFKAPIPVEPWTGVKDCTNEGAECPAKHMYFGYQIGDLDNCLNLNVHTKALPGDNIPLKPVMVWIHGGGFLYGSNSNSTFGPEYLMSEDIVLVSINYRLGIFGFLSLKNPELEVPGNAGLKDQVLALKWVQKNIKQFNGDPNNVTIFGESAGGASVHLQYISPASKGLYHKAIAQSGCALNVWARGITNGEIAAKHTGCKETDEKEILKYLEEAPISKLIKASYKETDVFTAETIRPFGPVVEPYTTDSAFLTEDPKEIIKKGAFNQVPIIMGFASREGIFFDIVRKLIPGAKLPTDFETEIPNDIKIQKRSEESKKLAESIQKFYYGDEIATEENIEKTHLLKSDTQFIYGIHKCVTSQQVTSKAPIYLYKMTVDSSLNYYKAISTSKALPVLFLCYFLSYKSGEGFAKNWVLKLGDSIPKKRPEGVCHADDLGYLFKSFMSSPITPGSQEDIYIKRFVKLWTNFAAHTNPTPDSDDKLLNKVQWKPVEKDQYHYLDIGEQLSVGVNPDEERMKFWDEIYNKYSN